MRILTPALVLFTLVITSPVMSQPVRNLVMEGAGIRGIAYVGAIRYLEEHGVIHDIERVGGTSAGAVTALAISLGYTSEEIAQLTYETDFQDFNDGKYFFLGGIARVNSNYGWYRGEAITHWIEDIIRAKTGDADITFCQLYEQGYKDLYVTGTSLNNQKLVVFSRKTYPDMKVRDAVRISVSIPLYFQAVHIDEKGNVISKKNAAGNFDLMVDGGFTGNFPISVFDEEGVDCSTIGLRIDSPEQIHYDSLGLGLAPIPVIRFRNYIPAVYNFVIESLNRPKLTDADWQRTISISSGDVGPKIRRLSVEEKDVLIANGYNATRAYFKKFHGI